MTGQILAACPDAEWRLLVCLARYGGLRTPSESLRLRWQDIDWERSRFTATSPKTEHHSGHESRIVPLFPELIEPLQECFAAAPEGAEYCITRYRLNNLNLRTHFKRIIKRAGLQPWPRLWQNLRSSRQSELCEQFPEFVVCAWIGNSRAVAREHYLQILPEHFERAVQRARQRAQYGAKPRCTAMQDTPTEDPENADLPLSDTLCKAMQMAGMGPAGFEPATNAL
ncbi:MAG: tyrosine-type recombinase/integrase [Phycisphaerales bacterium]|nr:MAG: tyrosine-type recombinase/integrase [Phycisphaerales bacterium]